jgi:solute carrier family 25 carnitine/acylcarnitine transporter 20/29
VRVSDSIIYLISKVLEPPPEALLTIMPNSKLSTFLASVLTSGLEKTINGEPSTTILVPPNSAFDELGLVATHLLLGEDDSKRDLVRVVKHHIIKGVVYRTGLGGNETSFEPTEGDGGTYGTLEGSDVRLADGTVTASGGWGNAATIDTTSLDTLTQTGVVHTLTSGVLIPRSVRIGLNELVRAAKGGTMRSLIVRAGFEGVFDGTLKLEEVEGWRPVDLEDRWDWNWDWPWNKKGKKGIDYKNVNWTILVPTDDAFKSVNLTRLLSDPVALRRLVMQHLIPIFPGSPAPPPDQPARPIPFQDSATFSTLLSPSSLHGDIALRQTTKGSFLLGIQGARSHSATNPSEGKNDFATITSYGRTTTGKSKVASGVIQLDRVLDPWIPGWWVAWGQAVTFGVLGVLGVCVFWGLVGWVWWKEESEATFEPLYGEDD